MDRSNVLFRTPVAVALASMVVLAQARDLRAQDVDGPAREQGTQPSPWVAWTAYWENDSFVWPKRFQSDRRYTNGIRYTLARDPERNWRWAAWFADVLFRHDLLGRHTTDYETVSSFVLGQNFFTPTIITSYDPDPSDRPFAGFLFAGGHVDVTRTMPGVRSGPFRRRVQHSLEWDLGVLGPPALASQTQKAVHTLRQSRIPKGWPKQLPFRPGIQLSYVYSLSARWHGLDLVPRGGVAMGTIQDYVNLGGTVRLGNVTSFPTLLNLWSVNAKRSEGGLRLAVLGGYEWRGYLYNAYVDGPLWGDPPPIQPIHSVHEWRLGFMSEWREWSFNYSFVSRSQEFVLPSTLESPGQHFGSFNLGRRLTGTPDPGAEHSWWTRDIILDAAIGNGFSSGGTSPGETSTVRGMAMRVGVLKGLWERILVGGELSGTIREATTIDSEGFHEDVFLISKALSVAWRPWGRRHTVILRGGPVWSLAKVERIRNEQKTAPVKDRGHGAFIGASVGRRLGTRASVALDISWNHLGLAANSGMPSRYLFWGVGVKWHP